MTYYFRFISLIVEYMSGFSLQDLIENVGILNESVICKIAIQIIQSIQEYKEKFSEDYGEFCGCDVLFDKSGVVKVKELSLFIFF